MTLKKEKSNQKSNFAKKILLLNAIFVFLFASCSNFIHELVPPQEKEIVSFSLKTEKNESIRSLESRNEKNITLTVPSNTDVKNLIPVIRVSDGASVLPLTLPYLFSAFPSMDLLTLSVKLNEVFSSKSVENWVFNFIQQNPDFNVPELSLPIDFSDPVYFLVVSGQGNTELYKVAVQKEPSSNSSDEQNPKDNSDGGDDSKDYSSVEKDILSFLVNAQEGESLIKEKSVEFSISNEVDISKLYPVVTVSQGASVLPLTQNYILSLNISFDKMLDFYSGYSTSKNLEKYCSDWLKNNDVELPKNLSLPIDFRESVVFAVVGSDKSVKLYTIKCNVLNNTPFIKTFAFTKDKNPGLMKDCFVQEESEKKYFAQLLYPVDYSDFALVPELVFYGDKITYKIGENEEIELVSGVTQIPFTAANKTCTIMLYKAGKKIEYSLTVNQTFDPDTIRSITDFRFYKSNNKDIKSSVMASIYDEGDTGQITITVNYQDQIPEILIPTFYSPGTVSVNQVEQVSGTSSQNFSLPVQYLCVSKNKMFSRLYTVCVEFNKVEAATALINSFNFSAYLNKGISYDVQGVINDANGTIDVEIPYSGESEPYSLTAQFAGTGTIFVDGIVQSSGYSVQNFSNNVYYKVVASDDESVSKQYVVRVSFKKDTDSLCEITSFKFLRSSQNPKLNEDVSALVVQRTKEIFVHLPFGSGSMDSLLTATFEAVGQVFVGEELQVSGFSKNDFSNVLTYKVVSANGKNSKEYTVTVQESGSVIYVNNLATGHNNGSSWQDAYITLDSALESIQSLGEQNSCEIWICDNGTEYKAQKLNNPLPICGTISIKGGFSGSETSASERDSSKKTKISNYCFDSKGSECSLSFERLEMVYSDDKYECIKMDYPLKPQSLIFNNIDFNGKSQILISGTSCKMNVKNSSFMKGIFSIKNGNFVTTNSVFDSCNIKEESQNCDFTEVTFKQVDIRSFGGILTIKNCVFEGNCEDSSYIMLYFASKEIKMSRCNFDNYIGLIAYRGSTYIEEINFSEKSSIVLANRENNYKYDFKNCNNLKFYKADQFYCKSLKIIGMSKDEKCSITLDKYFSMLFYIENIYLENVISSFTFVLAGDKCEIYINNCDLKGFGYYNYGYFKEMKGKIFNSNFNGNFDMSKVEFSDLLIKNCDFQSKIYFNEGNVNIEECIIENESNPVFDCNGTNLNILNTNIASKYMRVFSNSLFSLYMKNVNVQGYMCFDANEIKIEDSTFCDYVLLEGNTVKISNSNFDSGTINCKKIEIDDCEFESLYSEAETLKINGCNFFSKSTVTEALSISADSISIKNSSIFSNSSPVARIYNSNECYFQGNTIKKTLQSLCLSFKKCNYINIQDNRFSNNNADESGLYISYSNLLFKTENTIPIVVYNNNTLIDKGSREKIYIACDGKVQFQNSSFDNVEISCTHEVYNCEFYDSYVELINNTLFEGTTLSDTVGSVKIEKCKFYNSEIDCYVPSYNFITTILFKDCSFNNCKNYLYRAPEEKFLIKYVDCIGL